jgi:MurNAc alpha-1-phosphate uridylyltransferase
MKVFILAAGRGERMRPLTDTTPKPLLSAGGKPLIVWHLERLAAAGLREVVVNRAHLGGQIEAALGDGCQFGLNIAYSPEPPGALETAGGIAQALPLLGDEPFLAVNGDIWCDWDFSAAQGIAQSLDQDQAHLVFVANPPHHPDGDFHLAGDRVGLAGTKVADTLTYAGIAVFSPHFFADLARGSVMKLRPLLDAGIARGVVCGEHHRGRWVDVGSPQRLAELDQELRSAWNIRRTAHDASN